MCSSRRSRGRSTGRARCPAPGGRRVRHVRATAETRDPRAARARRRRPRSCRTGAGIYDHFLEQLAFHGGLDLVLEGAGDLETGAHHTAEDAALAFGEALDEALGDRRGIARYGDAVVPMDDALARASVDLGGRPWCECKLERDPGLAGARPPEPVPGRPPRSARRGNGAGRAPRRGGGLQSRRPCAAGSRPARERRPSVDEGARCDGSPSATYGAGNVRSRRDCALACGSGADVRLRRATPDDGRGRPDRGVLPGVGSAAQRMEELRARGLDAALRERVAAGRPTLGICLGLQLALEESEEDGGVEGLGHPAGTGRSASRGPRAADRLGVRRARAAPPTTSPTRTPPRRPPRPRSPRASSPRRVAGASSACSSTRRRAARRAPATSSDASPAPDPLPRRRRRPCGEGRSLRGPARRRRPGRARAPPTPTPAPTSSSSST